jgi:ABC-2 type transport system ATP-binding protein
MIEVKDLTKRYGNVAAVNGISVSIQRGEIVGLLGPNGAGKTTTMRMLTGFLPATSGELQVAGFDVRRQSREVRRRLGYMPESTPLYLTMTVRRYLHFMAAIKEVSASERAKRVGEAMESTGITHVAERLIKHLSKGYRQRVGLAQAIVSDPELLILDEPSIGLDPTQIIEIRRLIRAMAEKRTVILSSHILPEVSEVCQRVVIINKGKIVADQPTRELARTLQREQRVTIEARGESAAIERALKSVPMVAKVIADQRDRESETHRFLVDAGAEGDLRAALARAVVEAGLDLLRLEEKTLSLEEIFVQLVTDKEAA